MKNKDTGADLRAAKKLLGLHKSLDKEKEMVKGKIETLLAEGNRLKDEKHFDEKGDFCPRWGAQLAFDRKFGDGDGDGVNMAMAIADMK